MSWSRGTRHLAALAAMATATLAAATAHADSARTDRAGTVHTTAAPRPAPRELAPLFRVVVAGILLEGAAVSRDGTLHVATADGELVDISPLGVATPFASIDEGFTHGPLGLSPERQLVAGAKTPLFVRALRRHALGPFPLGIGRPPITGSSPAAAPVSDGAGGAWTARGQRWFHLSGDRVLSDGTLPKPAAGFISLGPRGALVIEVGGALHLLGGGEAPPLVLPGARTATGGVALGEDAALVVCQDGALARIDLAEQRIEILEAPRALTTPVARGAGAAYLDGTGTLVLLDPKGLVTSRAALTVRGAELLGLAAGAVAAATTSGEVLLVDAAGTVTATGKGCDTPLGVYSGPDRVLVMCRDGQILALGTADRK